MKNHYYLLITLFLIVSCGTLNHNRLQYSKTKTNNSVSLTEDKITISQNELSSSNEYLEDKTSSDNASISDGIIINVEEKIEYNSGSDCDILLLRSGEEISVKVLEIGTQEIKYKKCDNQQGPTISVLKNDVFMITYANGSKDVFKVENKATTSNNNTSTTNNNSSNTPVKTNGMAVASFVFGLLGFVPILGLIFGLIALGQINNNPGKFTGKGMAITGILLSILWIVILIILFL
jgi:hypothetical protein